MADNRPLPTGWTATLLPAPKRYSRSKAIGFCRGSAVGHAESAQGRTAACWWPAEQPALITLDRYKEVHVLAAGGGTMVGSWNKSKSGHRGAAVWHADGGLLRGSDLHDARFEDSWANGVGGDLIVGVGTYKGKLGKRPPDSGLVWRSATELIEITASEDVCLTATDGTQIAGSIGGRAALWRSFDAAPVDLANDETPASEVRAVDGDLQIGYGFDRKGARALLWRGTAKSVIDLTPKGHQEARAFGGASGFQVGFVRAKVRTRTGLAACDDRAVLWDGAADRWVDLNAFLPPPFNASVAWAIGVHADQIVVCGVASQVALDNPRASPKGQLVAEACAVVWRCRLPAPSLSPAKVRVRTSVESRS
jgi:hypothetical protein